MVIELQSSAYNIITVKVSTGNDTEITIYPNLPIDILSYELANFSLTGDKSIIDLSVGICVVEINGDITPSKLIVK